MGIRFSCQHCQKLLNVKRTQAGLVGICPFCRGVIEVPVEAPQALTSDHDTKIAQTDKQGLSENSHPTNETQISQLAACDDSITHLSDEDHQETVEGLEPNQNRSESNPAELSFFLDRPLTAETRQHANKDLQPDSTDSSSLFLLERPELPLELDRTDPIESAPDRVWYFRDKKGRETGPLKAKQMIRALESNCVTVGTLVWRDDWEQWLVAESVFPSLKPKRVDQNQNRKLKFGNFSFSWTGTLLVLSGLMIVGILVYWMVRVLQ